MSILKNYDAKRAEVLEALRRANLVPDAASVERMYEVPQEIDARAQATTRDLADRFALFSLKGSVKPAPASPVARVLKTLARYRAVRAPASRARFSAKNAIRWARATRASLRHYRGNLRHTARYGIEKTLGIQGATAAEMARLTTVPELRHRLVADSERSSLERRNKLQYLTSLVPQRRLDRVRLFREMIRLERLSGNDLVAATYALRIMRWMGNDEFKLLSFITHTLREHGFVRDAEAAESMYRDPALSYETSRAFLEDQLQRHRSKGDLPLEFLDERRGNRRCRVSIIVSLYNAADKMPAFMRMLQQQRMLQSGDAEVVFVDSGSPAGEYDAFKALWAQKPFPAVFARSEKRETIQAAWNRGIKLAKADYLAFLGVDEGIRPDCLDILASELDRHSDVDWVMADLIVTSVDRNAVFDRDVMSYDRTGYRHPWHYLDCTFLSYVGGLYRHTIHDRLGYYDETFRAAGDTEFKNRILPFIKSKYIAQPLGVFNNYPDDRTTQHPRAEIEDLRAWYIHRSAAGASYAFASRPNGEAAELLRDALAYRKCFCQHTSSDIELAKSLSTHLVNGPDGARWKTTDGLLDRVLELYQGFELLPNHQSAARHQMAFARDWKKLQTLRQRLQRTLEMSREPALDVFNDNRYEQHWWSWSA